MKNLANEVLKYYFDLYCDPESTYIDDVYVVEEIERLATELKEKYDPEEQQALMIAAKEWLSYFEKNSDMHTYTRKTNWNIYETDFLHHIASGEFREQEIYIDTMDQED